MYTLQPASVDERQICADGAPEPSGPGEEIAPGHQAESHTWWARLWREGLRQGGEGTGLRVVPK